MYRFFYNHEALGDILFLLIEPSLKVNKKVEHDDVVALYHDDIFVGANFFNIGRVMKFKANGMIVKPNSKMIEIVNDLLKTVDVPALEYKEDSGYKILEIESLEEHPLDAKASIVTLTDENNNTLSTVSNYQNLHEGDQVVCLKPNFIDYEGVKFVKHQEKNIDIDVIICSPKQLTINEDNNIALKVEDDRLGEDFFK